MVNEPQERNLGSSGRYSGTYVVINGPVRERPDDGGPLDQPSLDALFAAIKASPARPVVNGWLRQAADAGESWNPRVRPTIRNFEISRAAYHMALATDGDDEVARTILAAVIPAERHTVIQPAFDVGVTLGALTIDEARAVVDVAERLTTTKSERGESPADVVAAVLAAA